MFLHFSLSTCMFDMVIFGEVYRAPGLIYDLGDYDMWEW